jgi:hypothetical protein
MYQYDEANTEHQGIYRHSKGCYHVARVSVQWPTLVDIFINVVVNNMRGDYREVATISFSKPFSMKLE